MTEPQGNIVQPALILQQAQGKIATNQLAGAIQRQIIPPGTSPAKVRLGYVQAFDPATWTCTALIGDLLTPIPNIAVLGEVYPAIESAAIFLQTGGERTTEYICVGTLPKDPGTPTYGRTWNLRTAADQTMTNSAGPVSDTYLKFQGQAGRTYLFTAQLIVCQNSINDMDIKIGWSLPSGGLWTGGGPGPISTIAAGTSLESTGAGANWRAGFNTSSTMLPYGVEVSGTNGVDGTSVSIFFTGSIKMGATSGLCALTWGQRVPLTATTRIREGSNLRVDMTTEYTL